jgi:16S rRNA (adenine1518-N6/adenine1519-N6)-dimethyltransferase
MPNREKTKAELAAIRLLPSKSMGQNFLTDPVLATWIAHQLSSTKEDTVVEIGPGLGAITQGLEDRSKRLILIELDRRLAAHLRNKYSDRPEVEVIETDASQVDIRPFFQYGPIKAIGNLPYSTGTEIVRHFLQNPSPVGGALFMLQTEVAERICAVPGKKNYGVLSLRVQSAWRPRILRELPAEPFYPPPRVGSAVILIEKRAPGELPVFDHRLFDRLIRQGFSQRRKQMKKLLPAPPNDDWADLCARLEIPETARAESLTLEKWIDLTNLYDPHPLKNHAQSADEIFDVVDEDNNIIAQHPRGKVHAEGLRHRAVHIFVLNKHGELFLQKRSHLKDMCPGLWDSSAAGHLDAGENYADCARRELQEELGIEADATKIGEIAACEETGWEFVELFEAQHNGPFTYPASEISGGRFFSINFLIKWAEERPIDFAPGYLKCLTIWLQK